MCVVLCLCTLMSTFSVAMRMQICTYNSPLSFLPLLHPLPPLLSSLPPRPTPHNSECTVFLKNNSQNIQTISKCFLLCNIIITVVYKNKTSTCTRMHSFQAAMNNQIFQKIYAKYTLPEGSIAHISTLRNERH